MYRPSASFLVVCNVFRVIVFYIMYCFDHIN